MSDMKNITNIAIAGLMLFVSISRTLSMDIFEAAKEGKSEIINDIIRTDKTKLKEKMKNGKTLLHVASEHGHIEIVNTLIKAGALVDEQDKFGDTPLFLASHNGHKEIVKRLIDAKADVNGKNRVGDILLFFAAGYGHTEVVEMLGRGGAKINEQSKGGITALHLACLDGNAETVKKLLELNANIHIRDNSGKTPEQEALEHGYAEIAQEIVSPPLDQKGRNLGSWIEQGDIFMVKEAIKNGINVNQLYPKGSHFLHVAISAGKPEIVEILLKAGARINLQDKNGQLLFSWPKQWVTWIIKRLEQRTRESQAIEPLCLAAKQGDKARVSEIIAQGINVNLQDQDLMTPLHWACFMGNSEIVEMLINAGANVYMQEQDLKTPLHLAAARGHVQVVEKLLQHQANVDILDNEKNKPADYALINKHREISAMLRRYVPVKQLYDAVEREDIDLLGELIAKGIKVNQKDENLVTPLHVAARKGRVNVTELLIQAGADVNAQDDQGSTPLHIATSQGDLEIIEKLIREGHAELNRQDNVGATPLYIATAGKNIQLVETLLSAGADPNTQNKDGQTPLHAAAQNGSKEIVDLLIKARAKVDMQDQELKTPLHLATLAKHKEIVEKLVRENADVNKLDALGTTPLYLATEMNDRQLMDIFGTKQNLNIQEKSCYVTFTQEDDRNAIVDAIFKTLFYKTIVISSCPMIYQLLKCKPTTIKYFESKQWTLFLNKDDNNLGVIIPELTSEPNELLKKYGFKNLSYVAPQDIAARFASTPAILSKDESNLLLDDFRNIIDETNPQHPTKFLLNGHGKLDLIANIPVEFVNKLFIHLAAINTQFLYIVTCYAAGQNLIKIQSTIQELIKNHLKEFLYAEYIKQGIEAGHIKTSFSPRPKAPGSLSMMLNYIIVLHATSDLTTAGIGNSNKLFELLNQYFKSGKPSVETALKSYGIKIPSALMSIRFPGTTTFFRAANIGEMEIITASKIRALKSQKFLKLALPRAKKQRLENLLKLEKDEGEKQALSVHIQQLETRIAELERQEIPQDIV